jgi:hypothetical protein
VPFDSPDINLGDLLKDVAAGKIQLPDFQREWKWNTDQIRSLLASISLGYPVGVIMTLEVGGDSIRFLPRTISGISLNQPKSPDQLILDGQQRLTSLYQSLYSGQAVDTKDPRGKKMVRWYYLDMARALDPEADREEAIVAIPKDRVTRNFRSEPTADYSTVEKECASEMFPLSCIFDGRELDKWMVAYLQLDSERMPERLARWSTFKDTVLKNFTAYTVPVIILKKDTPKEAVCTVFEKVNTGGITLNVFELLTASFAADNYRLNLDWKQRRESLNSHPVLRSVQNTDFLQCVALLTTYERRHAYLARGNDPADAPGISCKRKDILGLTVTDYQKWADPVSHALVWSARFLAGEHIFQARDVPYRTQLIPLAAIRVVLGDQGEVYGVTDRLRQWYWCGVLGELYGGTTESRFARDLGDVVEWINGGSTPSTVEEASFNPGRLMTLRTRNSAAYKGIYALLMREDCVDWMFDQSIDLASFFDQSLDIHHIFPKAWCASRIDPGRRESIVNKTALSYKTNRIIGGNAPSKYLPIVERRSGLTPEKLNRILMGHAIDPDLLRSDDFDAFFDARTTSLLSLIGSAMGKELFLQDQEPEGPEDFEEEVADPEDEDLIVLTEQPA